MVTGTVQPKPLVPGAGDARVASPAERNALLVLVAAALPWLCVILALGRVAAALAFAAYALLAVLVGWLLLGILLPRAQRAGSLFLAPVGGIFVLSALSALALRARMTIAVIALLWGCLALAGAVVMVRDRRGWTRARTPYGRSLVVFSLLICLLYFLPAARRDAVVQKDGSFNWMYVDTQHFYAIAASIRAGERPPVGPGTATEPLRYHFGPYAPAGILSAVAGLPLGDALARVTRGASQWALLLACFAAGMLLSRRATGKAFGGIASVAGLFFYGSLFALFTLERSSASYVKAAVLYAIPGVEIPADGGPFSHVILGHSILHGLGALTLILALCLLRRPAAARPPSMRDSLLLALPALAIPVNSVAALDSLLIVGILLFWGHLRRLRSWLGLAAMSVLFVLVWSAMGLLHAADSAGATVNLQFGALWWSLVGCCVMGLGLRLLALRWIHWPLRDPVSALVLATLGALLCFAIFLRLPDGNQHYGFYYLYCLSSLFAFSRIPPRFWQAEIRARLLAEWLVIARAAVGALAVGGLLVAAGSVAMHHKTGVKTFGPKLLLVLALAGALAALVPWMRRRPSASRVVVGVVAPVLLIGFLAWIAPWQDFALGRMRMDVTISPGELQGLERLRTLSRPGEIFATNRHAVPTLASLRERSYAYMALSERPVLLEGYLDRGVTFLPWFPAMQRDNDLLFTTTRPDQLQQAAARWHVHWLVARPGTDISLPRPLPSWLIPESGTGSLKIYEILPASGAPSR